MRDTGEVPVLPDGIPVISQLIRYPRTNFRFRIRKRSGSYKDEEGDGGYLPPSDYFLDGGYPPPTRGRRSGIPPLLMQVRTTLLPTCRQNEKSRLRRYPRTNFRFRIRKRSGPHKDGEEGGGTSPPTDLIFGWGLPPTRLREEVGPPSSPVNVPVSFHSPFRREKVVSCPDNFFMYGPDD